MSILKLEYEILISGIYPFKGDFEKFGFKIIKNIIDESFCNNLFEKSVIYLSPFIGTCCYPDSDGTIVYLTFYKEEVIEIDYGDKEEYDIAFTSQYMESLNLFAPVEMLEKTMVLEVNNHIKFPIKMVKAYNTKDKLVTFLADFMRLNVPSLLSNDQEQAFEVMKRQNNRLNCGISYEKVSELAQNNKFFKNAITMYYSSFSVSDYNVGFTLLVIALESLLSLSTYSKPEICNSCGKAKYAITSTIAQNVSLILMDHDNAIKKRIRDLYGVRSKFVHTGKEIAKEDEQEMQEFVRKVLLMYWCVSICKVTYEHKVIMKEIQSAEYKENILYQNFLTFLENTSFDEKHIKMVRDIFLSLSGLRKDESKNNS